MPNIVTHAVITEEFLVDPPIDMVLGSTLPDFIGMYRDYEGQKIDSVTFKQNRNFKRGIAIHTKTDEVFDAAPIRNELLADAVNDYKTSMPEIDLRLARRLANISTDILIDPALMRTIEGRETYNRLKVAVLSGDTALKTVAPDMFVELVEQYFRTDRATMYENSEWLAAMLQDRFARRSPRLSFHAALLPGIATVLSRHQQRVKKVSGPLLDQTLEGLQKIDAFF